MKSSRSIEQNHGNWHNASADDIASITRGSRPLLLVILAAVVVFIVWATYSEIDEITRGAGKVIPSSQVQSIQNLEGGIVKEILVKEGDLVEAGQVLMVLDDTRFTSEQGSQKASVFALKARRARLQAEVEHSKPVMESQVLQQAPELAHRELELFENRQRELTTSIAVYEQQLLQQINQKEEVQAQSDALKRRLALIDEELKLSQELAKEGAVSRVEVLRLARQVSDTRGELQVNKETLERLAAQIQEAKARVQEVKLGFANKARTELNEVLAKLQELRARDTAVNDQVERTRVRAPMRGIVKQVMINTEGGVVQPGMKMMELIPVDDSLEVEVKIRPEDIAFLHPGQKASVRFTAYDFTIYGGLEGKLTHISADTITNQKGESYYLARIKTDNSHLGGKDSNQPIIAGMVASVDILTGKKTLLEYLLKPILRAKQLAFTER